MQFAYHIAVIRKLRRQLAEARSERDAARQVISELTDELRVVTDERDAALRDLDESMRLNREAATLLAHRHISEALFAPVDEHAEAITYELR